MIGLLDRNRFYSTEEFLFYIYNNLGFTDLEVAYNYFRKDGSVGFSKWIRFDYLQSIDCDEKVEGTFDTKEQFLNKITHRRVLDIEVMLDIDSTPQNSEKVEDIKQYAKEILFNLRNLGYSFIPYYSGSKSIHVSFLFPELRNVSKRIREDFKKEFILKFSGDIAKSSNRNMIALEGVPHWKTGVNKEVFVYE